MSTRIRVEMKPISTILTRLGIDKTGDVQKEVTNIINKRLTRYMPYRTGALTTKLKYVQDPITIVVSAPYARYQYYGKKRVNAKTGKGPAFLEGIGFRYKSGTVTKLTDIDLKYDTTHHARAGPFWDRRMMAAEKGAIISDIQEYVRRKGK